MQRIALSLAFLFVCALAIGACGSSSGGSFTASTAPTIALVTPAQGTSAGGTAVVVTGTNFDTDPGDTTVTVGGNGVVGLNVASATSLSFTTPPGVAGPANVVVTTPTGTVTLVGGFLYTANIDAIVGSRNGDHLLIFRDILNHGGLGADVALDPAGSGIDNCGHFDCENDWLVASCRDNDSVRVFSGLSTLLDGQAPTAAIFVDRPTGICLVGGDVYVCSQDDNNVQIFRDVTTLAGGDPPDALLSGYSCPVDCAVVGDILYVADRCNGNVHVYNSASTLVTGATPDATLTVSNARRLGVFNNTLWVHANSSVVAGYAPANALVTGQAPTTGVFGLVKISDRASFTISGNQMFVMNNDDVSDVMLSRIDLPVSMISPAAEIEFGDIGFDGGYDVQYAAGVLVVSAYYAAPGMAFYLNALGLADGQIPDGYLFDLRLDDTKDVKLIVN